MPLALQPDLATSSTEPGNDLAWMNVILSPSSSDVPLLFALPLSPADGLALELDPDLPPSSLRLQFLRAWIAARGDRHAEAPGHA